MTVCIAALSDSRKAVVVASDRQVTLAAAGLEIEHPESKIDQLAARVLVMTSGDRILGSTLIERTRSELASAEPVTVRAAAERLCANLQAQHVPRMERVVLAPLGYTVDTFQRNASTQLPKDLYGLVFNKVWDFGMNAVEFLVCGVDDSGAHLFRVFYAGIAGGDWLQWLNGMAYYSIGAGMNAALAVLSLGRQHSGLDTRLTLFNVFNAKKTAQITPSVGHETDAAIVTSHGVTRLSPEQMAQLEGFWVARQEELAKVKGLDKLPDGSLPAQK
jgi:hypothetical protein